MKRDRERDKRNGKGDGVSLFCPPRFPFNPTCRVVNSHEVLFVCVLLLPFARLSKIESEFTAQLTQNKCVNSS